MSVWEKIFGTQQVTPPINQPPGSPQQPNVGAPGTQTSTGTPPNGTVPNMDGINNQIQEPVNPLDKLNDLWTLPKDAPAPESVADIFKGLDPAKFQEQAKTVDFGSVMTPELLQKAVAGGQEGVAALMTAMNTMAQQVYARSTLASTKIAEQALTKASEIQLRTTQEQMRRTGAREGAANENAVLSHPAFQPIVGALTEQFARKNPTASQSDIQKSVLETLSTMGTALNPTKLADGTKSGAKQEEDWSKFFGM